MNNCKYLIFIHGTPGTGKTTFSIRLKHYIESKLHLRTHYIRLPTLIIRERLYKTFDRKRKCFVFDEEKRHQIVDSIESYLQVYDVLLIENIFPFLSYEDLLELMNHQQMKSSELKSHSFLLVCKPSILFKRLLKRSWPLSKILENTFAEFHGVVHDEYNKWLSEVCNLIVSSLVLDNSFGDSLTFVKTKLTELMFSSIGLDGSCHVKEFREPIGWFHDHEENMFILSISSLEVSQQFQCYGET